MLDIIRAKKYQAGIHYQHICQSPVSIPYYYNKQSYQYRFLTGRFFQMPTGYYPLGQSGSQ